MNQRLGTLAVIALADPARRLEGASALAARLGVQHVIVMLRDPLVSALVPAPGFPQTLRGGPAWRAFLKRCLEPGRHVADVDCFGETNQRVEAWVRHGLALVMCGGEPNRTELAEIEPMLPLLALALEGERRAFLARAEAEDARSLASRAQVFANALDAARQEATRLNAQLREEHRRKDEFLAMLAHELRNPLSPLVTSIEILRRRSAAQDSDGARLLDIMRRQTSHLSRLVDDLLDISRVTRGKIELRAELLSLWDVVNNAIEVSRALIQAKGHELVLSPPAIPVKVHADPVRLTQVVSNLLNNAAKYTPVNGRIEVVAGSDSREAFVRITDNGIGIAPEMLDAVFELFAQVPTAPEQSLGGLGIGLTLVRSLVEMHGGRVSAQSAGLGAGSTFCIRLPVGQRAPRETVARPEAGDASVLVVTADSGFVDAARTALEPCGHRVEGAYSALTALQLPVHMHFDLVLLDSALPDVDLGDLAARLRRLMSPSTCIAVAGGRTPSNAPAIDASVPTPLTRELLKPLLLRALESDLAENERR